MDAVSDPLIPEVVVMSSAQVGKTLIVKAIIGFHIDQDPAPILVVQPTIEMAETFSKDRLAPMIRDTPALRGKVKDPRSRDSGNTLLQKQFPGGHITLAGANAPAGLASRPIRIVLCDEVDRYPASAGTEGDPVSLARKRTSTFWNRKIVLTSTPGLKGVSRIEVAWEQSDQRRYHVPCPHCGHFHSLEWERVSWEDGRPDTARMSCPECGGIYGDSDKLRMLRQGEWVAENPGSTVAGFHINELYSPWLTFGDVVASYLRSKDSPEQFKTWVNTSLGLPFAEVGEAPEWQRLFDKRESYPIGSVPEEVVMLTAGVDVQKDRLELEVVGWAPGKRSYSVEYRVIDGDTANQGENGPWAVLRDIVNTETWRHSSGVELPLRYTCVDSGFNTSEVYDFCRSVGMAKAAPTKGMDEQGAVISQPRPVDRKKDGKKVWRGLKLYTVGVSVCKSEFYGWLRLDKAEDGSSPPGYCCFPEYSQHHFKELTSEQMMVKFVRGYPKHVWVKSKGIRNEPLDCRVYARAAAAIVGIDRYRPKDWENLRAQVGIPDKPQEAEPASSVETLQQKTQKQDATNEPAKRRPSSFWNR